MATSHRPDHESFMRRALLLARRGEGRVEPNPMVGCVIVKRGRIIGEGHHRRFGGPHAEIEALSNSTGAVRGATVYVTLEPCCYHGKTPPCSVALIEAGVARVVCGTRDPNPRVAGRGLRALRKAGIDVEVGLCEHEARALIAPFMKLTKRRRPWVILKWAQSLDGKIATHTGDSKWITDETMRAHAHRIRGRLDGIIVGRLTAERDDPLLTCRVGRPRRVATRIVLDAQLRLPTSAQLVRTARDVPTWVFCAPDAPARRAERLRAQAAAVHRVPAREDGLALDAVLDVLGRHEMTNVLVEGGGRVLGRFFDAGLADEIHLYLAPRLIGGATATGALHGSGLAEVAGAPSLADQGRLRKLGSGWLFQARLDA